MPFVNAGMCGVPAQACWLTVSSAADILIASTLAIEGIAMAPVSAWIVACTLAAAAAFTVVADMVKIPTFRGLGIV